MVIGLLSIWILPEVVWAPKYCLLPQIINAVNISCTVLFKYKISTNLKYSLCFIEITLDWAIYCEYLFTYTVGLRVVWYVKDKYTKRTAMGKYFQTLQILLPTLSILLTFSDHSNGLGRSIQHSVNGEKLERVAVLWGPKCFLLGAFQLSPCLLKAKR